MVYYNTCVRCFVSGFYVMYGVEFDRDEKSYFLGGEGGFFSCQKKEGVL